MQNTPLPRDVMMPSATWRERRRKKRFPVVTSASLRPVAQHAFDPDAESHDAIAEHLVVVHDVSLDGLGLRSRLPLDICSQYRINCEDRNVFLRSSKLRVISCRRGRDGMYEIGAQLCNGR